MQGGKGRVGGMGHHVQQVGDTAALGTFLFALVRIISLWFIDLRNDRSASVFVSNIDITSRILRMIRS